MSESLIVALVILVGVFVIMIVTIVKAGHEAAIKMWGVMGALTGVAFGAITTYYFTDQVRKREVAAVEAKSAKLEFALALATSKASDAASLVDPLYTILKGKGVDVGAFPTSAKYANALPEAERAELVQRFEKTSALLTQIQDLKVNSAGPTASAPQQKSSP